MTKTLKITIAEVGWYDRPNRVFLIKSQYQLLPFIMNRMNI